MDNCALCDRNELCGNAASKPDCQDYRDYSPTAAADGAGILIKVEKSSQVDTVFYGINGVLRVKFKTGGTYDYEGVPPDVFNELQAAKSIGSFLHSRIKPHYKAVKVPEVGEVKS